MLVNTEQEFYLRYLEYEVTSKKQKTRYQTSCSTSSSNILDLLTKRIVKKY
jgi:hypothetical protein